MNVESVLAQLDRDAVENKGINAENILATGVEEALEEGDYGSLLQLLNELESFYQERGRLDEAYQVGDSLFGLFDKLGLKGSIPYATSLLNVATAYRAGGRLADALVLFDEAGKVYAESLPEDSLLLANYYISRSFLLRELGNAGETIECLKKALKIEERSGESYETAVIHAGLATTYIGLFEYEEALAEAEHAGKIFEEKAALDAQAASALYAKGLSLEGLGRRDEAKEALDRAAGILEAIGEKTELYYHIKDELNGLD